MHFNGIILLIIFVIVIVNILKAARGKNSGGGGGFFASGRRNGSWSSVAEILGLSPDESGAARISGVMGGLRVEAGEAPGVSGEMLTFCRVNFPSSLGIGLRIEKLDGAPEGETAEPCFRIRELDFPGTTVSASGEKPLHDFLTQRRTNTLRNCLGIYRGVIVTDGFVELQTDRIADVPPIVNFIERVVSAANCLFGAVSGTVAPDPVAEPVATPKRPIPLSEEEESPEISVAGASSNGEISVPRSHARVISPEPEEEPAPSAGTSPEKPDGRENPESVAAEPVPHVSEPEREELPPQEEAESTDAEILSKSLFSASFPGEAEKNLFETVKGRRVEWSGTLKSVYSFRSDFVFGNGPGTKATFEICEISGSYGMKSRVKATVGLGPEAEALLKGAMGKTVSFSGTLLKFEPFAKEIFLSDGTLSR